MIIRKEMFQKNQKGVQKIKVLIPGKKFNLIKQGQNFGVSQIMTRVWRVFIRTGTVQHYYAGAPGGSHLKDTWRTCNTLEVVPCSHARMDCRMVVPASPGFMWRIEHLKIDLMFVSVSPADKDTEKTFDSFNRMHMIWIDRFETGA